VSQPQSEESPPSRGHFLGFLTKSYYVLLLVDAPCTLELVLALEILDLGFNRRIYRRGFTDFTLEGIFALGSLFLWGNSKFYLRVKSLPGVFPKPPFGLILDSTVLRLYPSHGALSASAGGTPLSPLIQHITLCGPGFVCVCLRAYVCAFFITTQAEHSCCICFCVFCISHIRQLTPQQQSAEPRNNAGAEALAVAICA